MKPAVYAGHARHWQPAPDAAHRFHAAVPSGYGCARPFHKRSHRSGRPHRNCHQYKPRVPPAPKNHLDSSAEAVAAVGVSEVGIDFSSLDKKPVYSVILLLSPDDNPDKHLQAMENIFRNLQKEDFRKFLRQATTEEAIKDAIVDHDTDFEG